MMISIDELFIYDHRIFRNCKGLKQLIVSDNIDPCNYIIIKNKILFDYEFLKERYGFTINDVDEDEELYNVEEFKIKITNGWFNSNDVKFVQVGDLRKPFLTKRGLGKFILKKGLYSDILYDWVFELTKGRLKPKFNDIENVIALTTFKHLPIFTNKKEFKDGTITNQDNEFVVNLSKIADLQKDEATGMSFELLREMYESSAIPNSPMVSGIRQSMRGLKSDF